jgi:hypothetical protein
VQVHACALLTFVDKYYEYNGDKDPDEKGLTIGGYESAWLADLVGAYILANTKNCFNDVSYYGLYRDGGIGIFKGMWSYDMIVEWRNNFQKEVNKLAGGEFLQFTCCIWLDKSRRDCPSIEYDKNVSAVRDYAFPYLDMEMFWSTKGSLHFRVHLKPNQQLKYLNNGSAHTKACLKAILAGVCNRLAKLTTINEENHNLPLNKLYPQHFKALSNANLLFEEPPTLTKELERIKLEDILKQENNNKKNVSDRNRRRSTFFSQAV